MNAVRPLQLSNPCPMATGSLNHESERLYCIGCKKSIVDFRNMPLDEVKDYLRVNTSACGIFTSEQVTVPRKSIVYRFRFFMLTVVALLGFNVKPVAAQSDQMKKDTATLEMCYEEDDSKSNSEIKEDEPSIKEHKYTKRWKRRNKTLLGCPDF